MSVEALYFDKGVKKTIVLIVLAAKLILMHSVLTVRFRFLNIYILLISRSLINRLEQAYY